MSRRTGNRFVTTGMQKCEIRRRRGAGGLLDVAHDREIEAFAIMRERRCRSGVRTTGSPL
jgi:hypothetical protein